MDRTHQNTPTAQLKEHINQRHSNLELLRILAALFVVILHYNMGTAFASTANMPVNYGILLFFESLSLCAVDIFVMISGYFLCTAKQVKIWKVLRLFMDVSIMSALIYSLKCILGDQFFTLREFLLSFIPLNWYVSVYAGLYLLFPFLNHIVQNRTRSQYQFMLLVFFLVLSVWASVIEVPAALFGPSYNALSPIGLSGNDDGYTLVNFLLMYFLGAYFRLHESAEFSPKRRNRALCVYLGVAVVSTMISTVALGWLISYCNPLIVIQAVAIFVVFQNIRIQSKLINSIAGCAFGVYLIHPFFYRFCQIHRFVTGNPLVIPFHLVLCAVLIYAVSALIYRIYQNMFGSVFRWLQKKLNFLSYTADGFMK